MKLIFIYGLPATGKLTVAQELAAITGFKLFHNHQVVDLLLSVFEFGSPEFVAFREEFWLSVFDQACRNRLPGMIFTFAPEATVRPAFISKFTSVAAAGGEVDFIELTCPLAELKRRMGSLSRHKYKKLTSVPSSSNSTRKAASKPTTCPSHALHRYQSHQSGPRRAPDCPRARPDPRMKGQPIPGFGSCPGRSRGFRPLKSLPHRGAVQRPGRGRTELHD